MGDEKGAGPMGTGRLHDELIALYWVIGVSVFFTLLIGASHAGEVA